MEGSLRLAGLMARVVYYEFDSVNKRTKHLALVAKKLTYDEAVAMDNALSLKIPPEFLAKVKDERSKVQPHSLQLTLDPVEASDTESCEELAVTYPDPESVQAAADTDDESLA